MAPMPGLGGASPRNRYTVSTERRSMNSMDVGRMPARATTRGKASTASEALPKGMRRTAVAAGRGSSRRMIFVKTASVPSEPTSRWMRS